MLQSMVKQFWNRHALLFAYRNVSSKDSLVLNCPFCLNQYIDICHVAGSLGGLQETLPKTLVFTGCA